MKVAIIGAGFAGLATAYFLQEHPSVHVTLFEAKDIGAGASGVASGLLHPYPGIKARRSQKAEEALQLSKMLLRIAEKHTPKLVSVHEGILRQSLDPEQHERLLQHAADFGDIDQIEENLFLIHSGITVYSQNYLEGLARAIQERGGEFVFEKIESLSDLSHFDHIVVAAGYGIKQFPECAPLKVKFLKGQALRLEGKPPRERSFISQGYMAHFGSDKEFDLGSTYEREFVDESPNLEVAKNLLAAKLAECAGGKILFCKAAVRVCPQNHYLPIVEKIEGNAHVFTGLGSRGLLYHGYFGKKLAEEILKTSG